jgi:hypothetical protein
MARNKKNLAWNLEVIKNEETRPKQIVETEGDLSIESGLNSTVYKFTNLDNDMWYIGFHKETDRAYFSSTTNSEFKSVLANKDSRLKFEILDKGSVEECRQIEYELLTELDAKNNPMSYNLHNGHPGLRKLNILLVKDIVNDINILRNRKTNDLKYLDRDKHIVGPEKASVLATFGKLQTRAMEIDRQNLFFVQDRIENGIGDYQLPVFVTMVSIDGEFHDIALISGNHTVQGYNTAGDHHPYTELDYIVLPPEIHQMLSEAEIRMISNDLNGDYNKGKAFSKADAIKECKEHHEKGHSWNTAAMQRRFMVLGLTKAQVNGVVRDVIDQIEKQDMQSVGKTVMSWDVTHSDILDFEIKKRKSDTTYVTSSASTTPNLNRILSEWLEEQRKRVEQGKSVQNKILVLVYHSSQHTKKQFSSIKESILKIQNLKESNDPLEEKLINEMSPLVIHPKIQFHELEMYISDTKVSQKQNEINKSVNDDTNVQEVLLAV